jgi:hypothetical protein
MVERGTREFDGIRIDTGHWPLLVMEMPERSVPDAAVSDALAHLELLMRQTPRGTKFFQITDLSRMKQVAPASQRKYAAEWATRTDPLAVRCRVGGAIVAASPLLRGMLTAVFWLSKRATPTTIVSTRSEGLLRGIQVIEEANAPLPAHLVHLRDQLRGSSRRGTEGGSQIQ